jgi:thioesterase domain-containing protein
LFGVPGAAGTPLQYRALGRRLRDAALWAFAYRGMDTRAIPDHSVAAVARRNIAAMREVQPAGPYRLVGYSFGGAVALEMARQVAADGDAVDLLALLEPPFPSGVRSRLDGSRAFAGRVQDRAIAAHPGTNLRARVARARSLVRVAGDYVARQAYLASAGVVRRHGLAQYDVFYELHGRLARPHTAAPFSGRSVVFASPQFLDAHRNELDRVLPSEADGASRREVPMVGDHLDLVREPNVAEVARVLEQMIEATG